MINLDQQLTDEQFAERFFELAALSPDQRADRLRQLRADDSDQAAAIESLLAAHDHQNGLPEGFDPQQAAALLQVDEQLSRPDQAGPFRLLEEIGRGGIGVIYRAEREGAGFRQKVAVKLIKRGMDSELIQARFRAERSILASLTHPHIASLIDGGVLEDDRLWFALEYVDGEILTDWCDAHKAGLDQRLELFEQICTAVQYAHSRLVVHRDIKPGNILVTADGTVKLLDFGIAKLLAEDGPPDSPLTEVGFCAMTPEYAAPEQIRREQVSTATDVHALGMVLYELLTGIHPYQWAQDSREQLSRAICDTLPNAPSLQIKDDDTDKPGIRPATWRRRLRGDLDTIILKALAKEQARRYSSVEALAADLQRYREGLPVQARRDSLVYRASRFIHRHRLGVLAMALLLVSLLVGLAGVMYQARQAELAASRAERSLDYLTALFEHGNVRRGGRIEQIDELLSRGAEQATEALGDDPLLQGSLLLRLAEVRLGRDQPALAEALARQALELLRRHLKDDDERITQALRVVGGSLYSSGEILQSEPILREVAARYAASGNVRGEAEAMTSVASSLRRSVGYEAAVEMQRTVVARLIEQPGANDEALAQARFALAVFATDAGDYVLAEDQHRQALELLAGTDEESELQRTDILLMLASLLDRTGRPLESRQVFEQVLATYSRLLPTNSPTLARANFQFAILLLGLNDHDLAGVHLQRVLNNESATEMVQAHARRYMGHAVLHLHGPDQALDWYEAARHAYQAIDGVAAAGQEYRARADLGHAQALSGALDDALNNLHAAVSGIEVMRGEQHYDLILPLSYLAHALRLNNQHEQANRVAERAVTMAESILGAENRLTLRARQLGSMPLESE